MVFLQNAILSSLQLGLNGPREPSASYQLPALRKIVWKDIYTTDTKNVPRIVCQSHICAYFCRNPGFLSTLMRKCIPRWSIHVGPYAFFLPPPFYQVTYIRCTQVFPLLASFALR